MPSLKILPVKEGVDEVNCPIYSSMDPIYTRKRNVTYKLEKVFGGRSVSLGQIGSEYIEAFVSYSVDLGDGMVPVDVKATLIVSSNDVFIRQVSTSRENTKPLNFTPVKKTLNPTRVRQMLDTLVTNSYLN